MFAHPRIARLTRIFALIPALTASCVQGALLEDHEPDDSALGAMDVEPSVDPAAGPEASPDEQRAAQLMQRHMKRLAAMPAGRVSGLVIDLHDAPIAGVRVKIGDQEALTDDAGAYELDAVPNGNYAVTFEHPAYVLNQRPLSVEPGEVPWLVGRLMPRGKVHHVNGKTGGVVHEGPLSLEFEPRDLVFQNGNELGDGDVDVMVTAVDPRVPGHVEAAPARLEGITASGEQVGLFSYGMLEVEIFQNGHKVQVRPGQTVRTSMNVSGGMPVAAGAAIPMWHHDTDLGLWVQERGTDARVREENGELVAVAELPHFSAWNYDKEADAVCAVVRVPAIGRVTSLRAVSTDASNYWSFTSQCQFDSARGSTCTTNVPAGSYGSIVSFSFQGQQEGSSTWVDLTTTLGNLTLTAIQGSQINAWLASNGKSSGSWCGIARPTIEVGSYINSQYQIGSFPSAVPANTVRFGLLGSTTAASSIGALSVSNGSDTGFSAMVANTQGAYANDFDRDGVQDYQDNCVARSNSSQADTNNNGIGDVCEAWCYIPPTLADASWYDADADGIDDLCDTSWSVYNPSQYQP